MIRQKFVASFKRQIFETIFQFVSSNSIASLFSDYLTIKLSFSHEGNFKIF